MTTPLTVFEEHGAYGLLDKDGNILYSAVFNQQQAHRLASNLLHGVEEDEQAALLAALASVHTEG